MTESQTPTTGRPPKKLRCKFCKETFNTSDMRTHDPECRRKHLMVAGQRLHLKKVEVEIVQVMENYGSLVKNVKTGRLITVKSPRAFREWMQRAAIRFHRPAKPKKKTAARKKVKK